VWRKRSGRPPVNHDHCKRASSSVSVAVSLGLSVCLPVDLSGRWVGCLAGQKTAGRLETSAGNSPASLPPGQQPGKLTTCLPLLRTALISLTACSAPPVRRGRFSYGMGVLPHAQRVQASSLWHPGPTLIRGWCRWPATPVVRSPWAKKPRGTSVRTILQATGSFVLCSRAQFRDLARDRPCDTMPHLSVTGCARCGV